MNVFTNPAALMAKMKIDPGDRPKVKVACLRAIANLKLDPAKTFLLSGFIDNYLRLSLVEEQQFQVEIDKIELPTEREDVMEITTSWMEKGIVEGRELGERALVIKLLTRKLRNISPEIVERVNGLNLERLEVLAEDLLDFTSLVDLEAWISSQN
jgi:Domain of unknown function (DUF4351)